jgi:hypothetical protein
MHLPDLAADRILARHTQDATRWFDNYGARRLFVKSGSELFQFFGLASAVAGKVDIHVLGVFCWPVLK